MDTTDLRAVRSFISGTWNGGGSDQSYAGQDFTAVNPTRSYQTIGPNGAVAVEGAPVSSAQTTAQLFSPTNLVLLGLAVAAFFVLRKA